MGPFVLIEGGSVTYMNLACEAGPGSGNNEHGNDYHYIMMITITISVTYQDLLVLTHDCCQMSHTCECS